MNNSLKLHLGSGPVSLTGWVNIDLDAPEADMLLDLRQPLPFTDESVSHVFSEHVIEHIEYDEALGLLKEIKRVLVPNGVVRLTTPDLSWLVLNYIGAITDGWGNLWQPGSPAQLLNQGMRYWGHYFIYDRPEMLRLLTHAGFGDVRFVSWGESVDPALEGLESRPYNREIIIEARIPKTDSAEHSGEYFRAGYAGHLEELLAKQGARLEELELSSHSHRAQVASSVDTLRAELGVARTKIDSVHAESAERASQLLRVEESHRSAVADVQRLAALLADAERRLAESQEREAYLAALREHENEIARLRNIVDERGTAVQRVESGLADVLRESEARAAQIAALNEALQSRDAYLNQLRGSLPGKLLMRAVKPSTSA